MRVFGKGFNFGQDGPGNRLVYHLSGCNMRCIWCSNADGMEMSAGKDYSLEEIIEESKSCKLMFFSGGGVTFTGGEATLQFDELKKVLQTLKCEDIHTCIETNGTNPRLLEILPFVDYPIMDFKHYDSDVLKKYTGIGNEIIKKNFENICKMGKNLLVRIPLINGINTDNPMGFAEYFRKYSTENCEFEFLPYHEYGKDKWQGEYQVKNGFINDEILKSFEETFKKYDLKTVKN